MRIGRTLAVAIATTLTIGSLSVMAQVDSRPGIIDRGGADRGGEVGRGGQDRGDNRGGVDRGGDWGRGDRGDHRRPGPPDWDRRFANACDATYFVRISTRAGATQERIILNNFGGRDRVDWQNTFQGRTYFGRGFCQSNFDGSASLRVRVNVGRMMSLFEGYVDCMGRLTGQFVREGISVDGQMVGNRGRGPELPPEPPRRH